MGKQTIWNFIKGIVIGGAMLIPGVSGGTTAIILGIYDELVHAVSSFFQNVKQNALILAVVLAGGIVGILLFARPLLFCFEQYPLPTMYFFFGAIAGSVPMMLKKARIERFRWNLLVYPVIGALLILLLKFLPENLFSLDMNGGFWEVLLLIAVGIIVAVALVLPGISCSYLLLLFGMYDLTIRAISELRLSYLVPLGVGILLGVILTTKLLEKALNSHTQGTYLVIFGFIIGSLIEIFPGIPFGMEFLICLLFFTIGFVLMLLLQRKEEHV